MGKCGGTGGMPLESGTIRTSVRNHQDYCWGKQDKIHRGKKIVRTPYNCEAILPHNYWGASKLVGLMRQLHSGLSILTNVTPSHYLKIIPIPWCCLTTKLESPPCVCQLRNQHCASGSKFFFFRVCRDPGSRGSCIFAGLNKENDIFWGGGYSILKNIYEKDFHKNVYSHFQ